MRILSSLPRRSDHKLSCGAFFIFLIFLCAVSGCASPYKAETRYRLIKPITSEELRYEDESILVRFRPERKRIYLTLWNKTQSPLKILWDQVLFTDPEGQTHRVLNSEETFLAVGEAAVGAPPLLASSVIPPGTSHGDYVRPQPKGPQEVYIFPEKDPQGSRFSLMLPLEVNDRTKVYTFSFEIAR